MSSGRAWPLPEAGLPSLRWKSEVLSIGLADSLTKNGLFSGEPCRSRPLDSLPAALTLELAVKSESFSALTDWVLRSGPQFHRTVVDRV